MKLYLVLIVIFVFVTVVSSLQESLTFDEVVYMQEGRKNLIAREFTEPYGPPLIKEVAALPIVLGLDRYIPSQYPSLRAFLARMMIVFLAVGLLWSVYKFVATELGSSVGIVSLFFLAFNPEILAHSHYVTLDIGVTLFFWLSFVAGVRVWRHPSLRNYLILGLFMGLAAASKLTVWLLLLGLIIVRNFKLLRIINYKVFGTAIIMALVIWGAYGFGKQLVIEKSENSDRVATRLVRWAKENNIPMLVRGINYLETQPVPLGGYMAIIKNTLIRSQQITVKEPHKLIVNWLYKTPLPYLFLIGYGGWVIWGIRKWRALVLCVIIWFFVLSLSGLPPLVRHLIPLAPFVAILGGVGAITLISKGWRYTAAILLVWYIGSVMWSAPHFITYANELLVSPELKVNRLSDSNLDWGQGLITFKKYLIAKQIGSVNFSYFGRDDGGAYGLESPERWGGYKVEEICRFHEIDLNFIRSDLDDTNELTAISVTNWHTCGYKNEARFNLSRVKEIVAGSILVF